MIVSGDRLGRLQVRRRGIRGSRGGATSNLAGTGHDRILSCAPRCRPSRPLPVCVDDGRYHLVSWPITVRIALAQINPTIADFDGNRRLVLSAAAEADLAAAELVVFPELALCGYPPKDLLERPGFVDAAAGSLDKLAAALAGCRAAVLVGFPERVPAGGVGRGLSNSAALIEGGKVTHIARKSLLPTYDVFDEWRYFDPAVEVRPIPFRGRRLGVSICEDIWNDADFWPQRLYRTDPIESLVAGGAEIIVNVSASPYTIEKRRLRPRMLAATARRWRRPLVFVNQVGGQDDLVFDGASLAFDAAGGVLARGREHESDLGLRHSAGRVGRVGSGDGTRKRPVGSRPGSPRTSDRLLRSGRRRVGAGGSRARDA